MIVPQAQCFALHAVDFDLAATRIGLDSLYGIEGQVGTEQIPRREAFALALELEQSELKTLYRDLVLMGRAAVKLMARRMNESLNLPKHQQELIEAIKRFVPEGSVRARKADPPSVRMPNAEAKPPRSSAACGARSSIDRITTHRSKLQQ